jgi:hypothetical integral membrane protein (TIGR02206 family)
MPADAVPPFVLFGPAHLSVLAGVVLALIFLHFRAHRLARRGAARPWDQDKVFAVILWLGWPLELLLSLFSLGFTWETFLPCHLCDVAAIIAGTALWTRKQWLADCAYFWGLSGTLNGLLTPDLPFGFPHPGFWQFFWLHGSVVAAAVYLAGGAGLTPSFRGAVRAFLLIQLYLVLAAGVNVLTGENFGFLCRKPPTASLLDVLGPWPWYIVSLQAVAIVFFLVLTGIAQLLRKIGPGKA